MTSDVPVFEVGGEWVPGAIAACDNALLCDRCSRRREAESRDRFVHQFTDWEAGGGQLLHIRLSVPHTLRCRLDVLLDGLAKAESSLRRSAAWKACGIVDWARVLHLRWSPRHGHHPHMHITALVRRGHELDVERLLPELQAAWSDRLIRQGFKRVRRRHGLFARVFTDALQAVYAWHWTDDDDDVEATDWEPPHQIDLGPEYEPDGFEPDHQTWSLHRVACAAFAGDAQAWRVWEEITVAMRGVHVVRASRMLDRLWAEHLKANPEPEPAEIATPAKVRVSGGLWERARHADVAEAGLAVGQAEGIDAMAQWWATRLNLTVTVDDMFTPPRIAVRDGPPKETTNHECSRDVRGQHRRHPHPGGHRRDGGARRAA